VTEVLVALIVGASTLGGVVLTQRSERKRAAADRAHDLLVRKQERRHGAYLDLMALLNRLLTAVDRTAPNFVKGQPIEPPPPLSDEESWRLNALADVVASDEVRTLMLAWTRNQSEFYNAVWLLQQVQQREGQPGASFRPSEIKAEYGVTTLGAVAEGRRAPESVVGGRSGDRCSRPRRAVRERRFSMAT
jgi:hypothetical protein